MLLVKFGRKFFFFWGFGGKSFDGRLFGLPRTCCGGYPLYLRYASVPLLSRSPSAENLYSAFIVEEMGAEIDGAEAN
jgi:hypothetical protein